jgi:probable F420-dependent oxidoreductase
MSSTKVRVQPATTDIVRDPSRHWAAVVPFAPAKVVADQARAFESAGLKGVLAPQIYGPPFIPLAVAAAATEHVTLLSGIAIAGTRSPVETAMAAIDLDRLSDGRFILGLGTSVRAWTEGIYGMPSSRPVARLREAVAVIRHVVAGIARGGLDPFEGEFHRHDFSEMQAIMPPPIRSHIPIWLAGNQRRTIRLAAEIADGVMCHPIWSVEWAAGEGSRAIADGLLRGRRSREDVHVMVGQFVAIDDDPRQAMDDARATVAFYAGVEAYEPLFAAHGYAEEARRCQAWVKRGDFIGGAHEVPDEMVERFALCGTADAVRRRFAPLRDVGDSFWLTPPLFGLPNERVAELAGRIGAAFYA